MGVENLTSEEEKSVDLIIKLATIQDITKISQVLTVVNLALQIGCYHSEYALAILSGMPESTKEIVRLAALEHIEMNPID